LSTHCCQLQLAYGQEGEILALVQGALMLVKRPKLKQTLKVEVLARRQKVEILILALKVKTRVMVQQ